MQLAALQQKGVVHIGRKDSPAVIYAYVHPASPDLLCVGSGRKGATTGPSGPSVLRSVPDPRGLRYIMICHHSSAEQIAQRIQQILSSRGLDRPAPEGAKASGSEAFFSATLDDVVYAYPPFAKIFLSEIPASEIGDARVIGNTSDRKASQHEEEVFEKRDSAMMRLRDILLLRHQGARTLVSIGMIMATLGGVGFGSLETMKNSPGGRSMLLSIEHATWVSLNVIEGSGYGILSPEERALRRASVVDAGSFRDWYSPLRTDDAGRSFGLPGEIDGFAIKTWIDGPVTDRTVHAAWRKPVTSTEVGEEALAAVAARARAAACEVVSSDDNVVSADEIRTVDGLVVLGRDVKHQFEVSSKDCRGAAGS